MSDRIVHSSMQRRPWRAVYGFALLALLPALLLCPGITRAGNNGERPISITVVSDDNYPPYIFRNDEGQVQGILVDQWQAWEKATGVRVNLVAMDWERAKQFMQEGKADVIDTIFYNEARAKLYDFTKPYANLDVPVFVHKNLGGISDVQSLRGFTVGVKAGDAVIDVLKRYGIHSLKEYESYKAIIDAARLGDIRVFSIDAPPALYYMYKFDLESEFRQAFVLYSGAFHRAVKKGDTGLLKLIEDGFAAIPAGKRQAIEEKWLGAPIASRLNLRLVFTVLGGIVAVALALAFFIFILRRRVRAKTAELAATLARLRTSEVRFRTMVETASEGVWRLDANSVTTYVNDTMVRLLGYAPEEMLGRRMEEFLFPEDQESHTGHMRERRAGASGRFERRFRTSAGGEVWTLASASPLQDEDGRFAGSFAMFTDITERKRVELALKDSENTLRSLFASMTDVILILDAQGRYLEIAPTNADRLYRPAAELLGRTVFDVFPPEQAGYFIEVIRKALDTGVSVSTDYRLVIGGREFWFAGNVSTLSADRVLWVARDITERKKGEEALFESRERLQLALDAANDGLWDWRLDTGEAYFSPHYYTMLGYEPDEFVPNFENFSKLLHPDDFASISEAIKTSLRDNETNSFEIRMRAKSGEWKWILTRSRVVDRNASGAPTRLAGTHTDITERKMAEQSLARKDALLGAMLRNLPFDFWARDRDQCIIMQSDESVRLWGDLRSGSQAEERIDPENRAAWAATNRLVLEGEVVSGDREFTTINGERRVFHDIVAPIRDGEVVLGILGVNIDITDRKKAEEAMARARDAADAANRAKSEFLANMSHEIRTPLNGIVGMIQLLDGSPLDDEQKRYAQAAIQSSQRLTSLLGDILDLSRIEARKFVLEQKPFVLADILNAVETLYRLPAGQKGVELTLSLDADLPRQLLGDEHRLRQVLFNLVGNAVKFTQSGKILVQVERLGPPSETRCRVLFMVSDTGVGIPLDMLDQTFQMFTQVEGSLSRSHQGAGLGLAIVRHLVTLMGGPGVDVSSEVGQGTAFSFVLPFGLPAPGAAGESCVTGGLSNCLSETPSLEGLRVLLVEDEEINQLALRTGLERRGLLVTCADNGEAALAFLRAGQFDCILMDIQMPGMNGLEVTQAIRTQPEFQDRADIPVIALTAFAMSGDRERFLAAGMDDYLAKPFTFDDLARILGRIRREWSTRLNTG